MRLMEMTHCRIWISELKDIAKEAIQNETGERKTKKQKQKKKSISELWHNFRQPSTQHSCHWSPEGKREKRGQQKNILEDIMTKMFPNLIKTIK